MFSGLLTGLLSLLLFASLAMGQSVDSLIQEGLKNNPQLKSLDYQIQAAGFRANAAQALPPPTIGVEFSQVPTTSTKLLNDAISNNVSISQMFMIGGKLSAMAEVEKKRGLVLEQNRGSLMAQLRAKIQMNYFQLWLLDRKVEVQERAIALLEELARTMVSHVQTNRMRQADLLIIQAEVSSEKLRLIDMHSKRVTIQNVLYALLGRNDFVADVRTDSILPSPSVAVSQDRLTEIVKESNPSLMAMERMKEMNESEIVVAKRELIPDIMIQAMVMRMPNGMILSSGSRSLEAIQHGAAGMAMQKTEWMYSIMASITLPFAPWSSSRSTGKADEMRATNLSIIAEKNAMQREMLSSLRSAVNRYVAADSLSRQYSNVILPLMREAAEAQTVAYQTGQVPINMVLDARQMELMKQDECLMAFVDRQMALAEIEMMTGSPLQ